MNFSPIPWARLRERAGGLAFALVLNAMLLLLLLTMAPPLDPPRIDDRNPVSFDLAPAQKEAEKTSQAPKAATDQDDAAKAERAEPVVRPQERVEKPRETPPSPFPFLTLSREQMASADIGKMAKSASGNGAQGPGNSMAAGPGEGPGGVQLFQAEWYREPTDAELSPYMPANSTGNGWGMVACKTVDHYHVENCQTLGESPLGSGLARAVRMAAWQFLVLPPRINGKPQVGSWVRIRIDYTRTVVRGDAPAGGGD